MHPSIAEKDRPETCCELCAKVKQCGDRVCEWVVDKKNGCKLCIKEGSECFMFKAKKEKTCKNIG